MSIGKNIKALRVADGITQRALGQAIGFSENTADIRIAQYESGARTPKRELIERFADYFSVEPAVLYAPDVDSYIAMLDTLKEIEVMCKQATLQIADYIRQCYEAVQQ
jgi:transcriptional regulator with XRE-family HTH domain